MDESLIIHMWTGRVWLDDWVVGQEALCGVKGDIETTDWSSSCTCEECKKLI